jgi:hypothetical protein
MGLQASRNPPYRFSEQEPYNGNSDGESNQKSREVRKGEVAVKQGEQYRYETCRKQRGNQNNNKCSFVVGIGYGFHAENEPDDGKKSIPHM